MLASAKVDELISKLSLLQGYVIQISKLASLIRNTIFMVLNVKDYGKHPYE